MFEVKQVAGSRADPSGKIPSGSYTGAGRRRWLRNSTIRPISNGSLSNATSQRIEGHRRVETRDRQVRRERSLLRRELAREGLVEGRRQAFEPPGAIVEPGPQDAGRAAVRERAEALDPRR